MSHKKHYLTEAELTEYEEAYHRWLDLVNEELTDPEPLPEDHDYYFDVRFLVRQRGVDCSSGRDIRGPYSARDIGIVRDVLARKLAELREMSKPLDQDWVTTGRAAALLGVATSTIRYHIMAGRLTVRKTAGGLNEILRADLKKIQDLKPGPNSGEGYRMKYEYWRGNENSGRWTYYGLRRGDAGALELLQKFIPDAERTTRAVTILDGIRDKSHLGFQSGLLQGYEYDQLMARGGASDSEKIEACAKDTRDWLDLQEQELHEAGEVE